MMSVRTLALGTVSSLCVVMGVLTPAPALALTNPERHYEMVSPPYKAGHSVLGIEAVAPDGESVAFASLGAFEKAPGITLGLGYLAHRKDGVGWSTVPIMPPETLMSYTAANDISKNLDLTLASGKPGSSNEEAFNSGVEAEIRLHQTDTLDESANWSLAGGMMLKTLDEKPFLAFYDGASANLCHILFEPRPEGALLPEAVGVGLQVYDLNRGCGGEPSSLRIVAVKNKLGSKTEPKEPEVLSPACAVQVGIGPYAPGFNENAFNAVSADGGTIYFTTGVTGDCADHHQLFVRLDGSKTLEVSRPLGPCVGEGGGVPGEVPCQGAAARAPADFTGASEDGSRVFFTTTERLNTTDDTDNKNDLYMAAIGCPPVEPGCAVAKREVTSLVQVSHDPNGNEPAEIQGVVRVSRDGSHIYFVARGVLLNQPERAALESTGRAVPQAGADNLYVYDSASGKTAFVADLCSGPQLSGTAEDVSCPADLAGAGTRNDIGLWSGAPEAQLNECYRPQPAECVGVREPGRFLVFSTFARLRLDDTDNAKDVYRYDAATDTLDRVSVGEAGSHANGNGVDEVVEGEVRPNADATISPVSSTKDLVRTQYEMGSRATTEDGSRIVFTSAEPLSPAAVNGLANAYEWHEGSVSLLSTGSAEEPINDVVISPSGSDVFFVTVQGLVPQDTDGANDIYDARLGAGFPAAAGPRQPCSGDACQGPLTNPAPLLVPGSVSQVAGENLGENLPPPSKATPKKLTRAQQFERALKACAKKPKSRRAACRRSTQKKYGKAARSAGRSGR